MKSQAETNDITRYVLREVYDERFRQDQMWGEQNHAPCDYLAILVEEVGEAAKECVAVRFGLDSADLLAARRNLRVELIQVAAVAVAMVEALDREGSA